MMDFIVSPPDVHEASGEYPVRASIPDEASYAFFRRYFVDARVDLRKNNYLGFWGGSSLSGYELVRLRQVLVDALSDLASRPAKFKVLQGWSSPNMSEEAEMWVVADRNTLLEITQAIIDAVELARATTNHISTMGD